MPRYLSLIQFTEQGIKAIDKSTQRAERFRSAVSAAGGNVEAAYWALGEFDGAVVFQAPDEKTAARLLLELGQQGNVRTRTVQVFDAAEFAAMSKGK
jgi:uncharacterized protein with GYD domain